MVSKSLLKRKWKRYKLQRDTAIEELNTLRREKDELLYSLCRDDVNHCANEMQQYEEFDTEFTDEEFDIIRKGIDSGLMMWDEVIQTAIDEVLAQRRQEAGA